MVFYEERKDGNKSEIEVMCNISQIFTTVHTFILIKTFCKLHERTKFILHWSSRVNEKSSKEQSRGVQLLRGERCKQLLVEGVRRCSGIHEGPALYEKLDIVLLKEANCVVQINVGSSLLDLSGFERSIRTRTRVLSKATNY